jgi:hypothetical protein
VNADHNLGSPRVPRYIQACPSVSWHLVDENTYKDERRVHERGTRDGSSILCKDNISCNNVYIIKTLVFCVYILAVCMTT